MGSLGRCLARSLPGPRCYCSAPAALQERTLLVAKPDAVQRRLLGDIIQRFERRGFQLVAMKLLQADRSLVEQHYEQLRLKPFYPALVAYMTSGPVVAMVRGQPGGRGGLSCPCRCPCPCPAGVGGLQRGAVHAGHGWGQQRRGDNPRGPQRAHHQVGPRGRAPGRWHCPHRCPLAGTWSMPATPPRRPSGRSASGSGGTSWWPGTAATGTTSTGSRVGPAGGTPPPINPGVPSSESSLLPRMSPGSSGRHWDVLGGTG
ncbi:nucleoside diphosphate kinase, mitochondrial isoform X1 [Passer domesticus]|uniref:nucleoside diphosphate kinase, mitochondrial isoform X1 n=1 Tax=Passer domesticus TaxID=48849 RepID=UPI0030FEB210